MALPVGLEPTQTASVVPRPSIRRWEHMVEKSGIEPPTSRLSGERSNRLSYFSINWRKREDSNLRRSCPLNALAGRRNQPTSATLP